jgi:hypothetical protein
MAEGPFGLRDSGAPVAIDLSRAATVVALNCPDGQLADPLVQSKPKTLLASANVVTSAFFGKSSIPGRRVIDFVSQIWSALLAG